MTETPKRYAVITGASAGIGLHTAQAFVDDHFEVINLSRRPCPIPNVLNIKVDLLDKGAVEDAIERLHTLIETPRPITLVHNAAIMPQDSIDRFDEEGFDAAMTLNVAIPALLSARLRPSMTDGSSILHIGSTLSEKGVPNRLSYVTSKHALVGLMRAMTQDLFGTGIHTVCICPGFTETEMLTTVLDPDPDFKASVLSMVSYGRLIQPEEIARLVRFCADNPTLNGAIIHANLGQREA